MKYIFLSASLILGFFFANSISLAVDTAGIDKVRGKQVLDSADFKVIDGFWSQGISEIVKTEDFSTISKVRGTILSRKGSDLASNQGQYTAQTSESANKYISAALKEADSINPADKAFAVKLNLLILIDGMADVKLTENALGQINDKNAAIRYWAVKCLSNEAFITKLNGDIAANSVLAKRITGQFDKIVQAVEPEILIMAGKFAAKVNIKEGQDLLIKIVENRIKEYQSGQISDELVDAEVLKLLSGKIQTEGIAAEDKAAVGREFAQLFSCVIQKYMAGGKADAQQKERLASVLAETEKSCIGNLLGVEQLKIRRAVSQDDMAMLKTEHDRILGSDGKAGELGTKLGFNYGKAADGSEKLAPAKFSK